MLYSKGHYHSGGKIGGGGAGGLEPLHFKCWPPSDTPIAVQCQTR